MRQLGLGIGPTFQTKPVGGGAPPPARIDFSGATAAENVASGAVLGALTVSNATGTPAYTLTNNDGGRVALSGSNITRGATALDFETHPLVTFIVSVAGTTPAISATTFNIDVTNVLEVTLAALGLSPSTIVEEAPAGTVVGAISGKSAGSTLTLTDDAGGRFALSGTNIVAGLTPTDFETATSHSITLNETHPDATARDTVLTITVTSSVVTGPPLDLDFTTGTLDPRVTFTRTTTATYVNASGLVVSAAINAPRFDHNPVTRAPRGLLLEEQRTNLALGSNEITGPYWMIYYNATPNTTIGPDGTMSGDQVGGGWNAQAHPAVTQGADYTASIYAKKFDKDWVQFGIYHLNVGNTFAFFNLVTGTVGTKQAGVSSASIENAGNGWWRLKVTAAAQSAQCSIAAGPVEGDNGAQNGTAQSWWWGAQLEAGTYATSLIPTVAAAVARGADVAAMTGANFSSWYNQPEGTLLFECESVAVSPAYLTLTGAGSHSEGTRFVGASGPIQIYGYDAGITQYTFTFPTPIVNTPFKIAHAYKVNDIGACYNGEAVQTDTTATINAPDRLDIGYDLPTGWSIGRGHARRLTYYNTRKSNAELQELTSPFDDPTQKLGLDFTTGVLDARVTFTRTTTATYTNAAGKVAVAAINAPRFDYDPVKLTPRGLLIEEQRTNLALQSGDLMNGAWVTYGDGTATGSRAASAVLSPDGASTATLLTMNRADNASRMQFYQVFTGTTATHAWSIYLKAKAGSEGKVVSVFLYNSAAMVGVINVTLTANWVRHETSGALLASSGCQAAVGYLNGVYGGGTQTGLVEFYAWGGQVEVGSVATSYIPTTTAAVTRGADVAAMTGANFSSWWPFDEGTVVHEWDIAPGAPGGARLFASDNPPYLFLQVRAPTRLGVMNYAAYGAELEVTSPPLGTRHKIAFAYKANDWGLSAAGGAVATDTDALSAGALVEARWNSAITVPAMRLARFDVYNVRKTNAELQALTIMPPTLDLDFTTGVLDPRVTFTRTTTATYTNAAGLVVGSPINGPRFDYDPVTHAPRGLLLEEQRTNQCLHSESFAAAGYWFLHDTTFGGYAAGIVDPAGGAKATEITFGTAAGDGASALYQGIGGFPVGAPATFSVWARAKTGTTTVRLWISDGGANYYKTADLPIVSTEWRRLSLTATVTPVGAGQVSIRNNVAGTSGGIYIFGAQLEFNAPFATSYIPTTTAAVTRAGDFAPIGGTNFSSWWTQSAGTIVFDAETYNVLAGSARVAEFDSGADNVGRNIIMLNDGNRQQFYTDSGINTFANAPHTNNTPFKVGFAFAANDFAGALNGSTVATAATSIPAGAGRVWLLSGCNGGGPLNGRIRRLTFYNMRKTNAELQALTT